LPDFAHTQIPFSLIIGEGRVGFGHKAYDLALARLQAQREVVAGSAFRATPAFSGLGNGLQRRLSLMKIHRLSEDVIITLQEFTDHADPNGAIIGSGVSLDSDFKCNTQGPEGIGCCDG